MEAKSKPSDPPAGQAGSPPKAGGKVDTEALRELLKLMAENDVVELEYEFGGLAVRLSKRSTYAAALGSTPPAAVVAGLPVNATAAEAAERAAQEEDRYLKIASPMVGTFYAAPSPDSPSFVSVGDEIDEDTVVCLIEAMKVYNEIKAGVAGRVARICVKNEDAVEFGQVLFLVEPA